MFADLRNAVVLITGANNPHGIGAATAQAFAAVGSRVALTYLRIAPEDYGLTAAEAAQAPGPGLPYYHALRTHTAGAVLDALHAQGAPAVAHEADLTDPSAIADLFSWVEETLGPVDVLVNNAAHYEEYDSIFTATPAGLARTFAVNAQATVLLTAEYVRRYQQRAGQWGRVINLSTDAAQLFPGQIAYGASKAAIEAFTRSIAVEVGPLGVTVNAVAPGPVQTGYISAEAEAGLLPTIPLGRLGLPDDIADVIVFLASHQARWLTGQVIKVSGGHAL